MSGAKAGFKPAGVSIGERTASTLQRATDRLDDTRQFEREDARDDPEIISEWFLGRISDGIRPSTGSPVGVAERGILVCLPDTLDPARFHGLMAGEIREGSLARWLRTAEGLGHCAMLGVDPGLGQRFTSPSTGSSEAPEPVYDIVLCAQRAAQDRVLIASNTRDGTDTAKSARTELWGGVHRPCDRDAITAAKGPRRASEPGGRSTTNGSSTMGAAPGHFR